MTSTSNTTVGTAMKMAVMDSPYLLLCEGCSFHVIELQGQRGPGFVSVGVEDSLAQQAESGSAVHLSLDHLDAVAFNDAGAVGQGQSVDDGVPVLIEPVGETRDRGDAAGVGGLVPGGLCGRLR
jgi:hypothetical protein